jgi:hypothetical protein
LLAINSKFIATNTQLQCITTYSLLTDNKKSALSILGREGTFECLELPGGADALLGVIPLEALGLNIDVQNQTLKPLPISPTDTYLTIL